MTWKSASRFALCLAAFLAAPALAADDPPDVPGDDIFGFTSATDVGKPGEMGLASENSFRAGKRFGQYGALSSKLEASRTLAENWWGAVSLFGDGHRVRNVDGLDDLRRGAFDGMSFEIARRIVERRPGQPFAVTLSIEPRWGRIDGTSGQRATSWSAEAKIFVDAVVVPDRLYWAFNLNWAPGVQQVVGEPGQWQPGASTNVSTALTLQIGDRLFVGGEARWLGAFNRPFLGRPAGQALFAGPTMAFKISDRLVFNAVWTPQLAGRANGSEFRRLDLDNFERSQFRLKLALGF